MKTNFLAAALLGSMTLASAASAAPELTVTEGTYNFGTITQGKKVQHNFVIKNSGDQPLQIKDVNVSCGCTAAKPSASVIAPGKKGELQVIFDSANFTGKVQKTVSLVTNAGKSPTYTFNMEGTILEVLGIAPHQIDLGPLKPGAAKLASVTVTNRGTGVVKVLSVSLTSNTLQVKPVIKKSELKAGESGTIELTVTARPDAKIMSGYLHITTDYGPKKELTVPIYASVAR